MPTKTLTTHGETTGPLSPLFPNGSMVRPVNGEYREGRVVSCYLSGDVRSYRVRVMRYGQAANVLFAESELQAIETEAAA